MRSIDQLNLEKVVSWVGCHPFNHRARTQHIPPFTGSLANSKTIVYILGDPCYEDLQAIALDSFHKHVMDIVYSCGSAVEVFVVNAHFPRLARESSDKQFATSTIEIETALTAQRDIVLRTRGEDDDTSCSSNGQPEVATVKFLEMYEYLEENDTDGEFTDQERRLLFSKSNRCSDHQPG